jgi:hypothetical protein
MRFEVFALPKQECAQVGSKRAEAAYNAAKEELAGEVYSAAPRQPEPFEVPHVSVTAYIGNGKDGYFRPESPFALWPALDGVFEGLMRANLIKSAALVPIVTTAVMPDCEVEGLAITIEELDRGVGE